MALKVCDETFYWYLTVLTRYEIDVPKTVVEGLSLEIPQFEQLNLWPCRLCGAMVHGGLRNKHRDFHKGVSE
jgi:hypothetical protein